MNIPGHPCSDHRYLLGEGPTWDDDAGLLRWVDIDRGQLWQARHAPDVDFVPHLAYTTETPLTAAIPVAGGGVLLAAGKGLVRLDPAGHGIDEVPVIPDTVHSRLNDGATDPVGRFFIGSLAHDGAGGHERLWRVEETGALRVVDDDLTISNGLGWSPDGGTFYSVDSIPGRIWRRSYDCDSGDLGTRHPFVLIEDGEPDGLTVDAEGNVWVAIWGAGEVRGYSTSGALIAIISTGVPLTTSCAFIGAALRTMLITTASKTVSGVPSLAEAGRLFCAKMPHPGQRVAPWEPVQFQREGSDGARVHS